MKRLVLVLLLTACAKEKVPSCAEVTDHMLATVKKEYAGHGDMGAAGNRQSAIEQCETRKVPASERRCIMSATSTEQIAQCRRGSVPKDEGSARK